MPYRVRRQKLVLPTSTLADACADFVILTLTEKFVRVDFVATFVASTRYYVLQADDDKP